MMSNTIITIIIIKLRDSQFFYILLFFNLSNDPVFLFKQCRECNNDKLNNTFIDDEFILFMNLYLDTQYTYRDTTFLFL